MNFTDFTDKWYWIMYLIPMIINTFLTIIIFFGYVRNTNYANLHKDPHQSEYYDWDEWRPAAILFLIIGFTPYVNVFLCIGYILCILGSLIAMLFKNDR